MNGPPQPQPEPESDDLGLSREDWDYLRIAYNFGLIEPEPGTVEEEAFRRMDAFARQEVQRIAEQREADEAWARQQADREPEAGS